jgi:molybdenum cofactor guanylyltransferase
MLAPMRLPGPRRAPPPVGVVLAGGAGRRLGGDKAVVALDGRPMLQYPLAALREAVGEVAVVVKRDTVLPRLDDDVRVWLEADEPRHPLTGLLRALRLAGGRAVLAVAVDLPLVRPALLRALATHRTTALAVVPRAGGRLQPLCARYEPEALDVLAQFGPVERLATVVERLAPAVLDVADDEDLLSVDAPEDVWRAAAALSRRSRTSSAPAGRSPGP